jgi:hypothetical protein
MVDVQSLIDALAVANGQISVLQEKANILQEKKAALQEKINHLREEQIELNRKMLDMVPRRQKQTRSDETRAKMSLSAKERGPLATIPATIARLKKAGDFEKAAVFEAQMAALADVKGASE